MKSNLYTVFVFLICLLITWLASFEVQKKEWVYQQKDIKNQSQTISHNIQQQLTNTALQLQLTADAWNSISDLNQQWNEDTNKIKSLNPYINEIKIYLLNKEKNLTMAPAYQLTSANQLENKKPSKYHRYLPETLSKQESSRLFMSPAFLLQNLDSSKRETAVYLHTPIFINNKLFAYLQAAVNLNKLLTYQINTLQLRSPFSLSEGGKLIFSKLPEIAHINQVSGQFSLPVLSQNWTLMVWSEKTGQSTVYINCIGTFLSFLLALLTYSVFSNLRVKKQLKTGKRELQQLNKQFKDNRSKLIQSNKLTSLGEIATGIAHEINQPLQVICIHADLCSESLKKENYSLVDKSFRTILSQIERIEKIVKQVGSFGRDSELDNYSKHDLRDIFASVINIVINQYKQEEVELRQVLPPSLATLYCNKIQIEQVLVNLLINAKDAVEQSKDKIVFIKAYTKQGKLFIEVSDSGSGIGEDKLDDIFTPFYTTKALGKGTGLGLSISYSIIHQHHGELTVSSEKGKGSTFTVCLPLQKI